MRSAALQGKQFGRLKVLKSAGLNKHFSTMWNCVCSCGALVTVSTGSLRSGNTTSCGCKRKESLTTHGHMAVKESSEHRSWHAMKQRCLNPNHMGYKNYGGRGISICERWMKFENFLADMGERPAGTTLDRIDNAGNYEPGNCRWATAKEQSNNRRPRDRSIELHMQSWASAS